LVANTNADTVTGIALKTWQIVDRLTAASNLTASATRR
jgi:hypothetical protein